MGHYVSYYFSPNRGADTTTIGFIDHCSSFCDVAIYSLTHNDIADALIRAAGRGVKVRVLIDALQAANAYADDEALEAAGIEVRRDTQSGAMHNKFMIGDGREGGMAVQTGSFNFSRNAAERNAENFVVVRLQYVAKGYQAEFERLWAMNAPE